MPNNRECLVGFKVLEKCNREIYSKLVCHEIIRLGATAEVKISSQVPEFNSKQTSIRWKKSDKAEKSPTLRSSSIDLAVYKFFYPEFHFIYDANGCLDELVLSIY